MQEALPRHRPAVDGTERRLAALHAAGLLGVPAEERFDRLTWLACQALRVPVALVSLLDGEWQFFLGAQGLPEPWVGLRQTPLAHSFCRAVVETGLPMSVADAREDARVRGTPAVADLGVGAYLAVPLALPPDGCAVGALCAIDREPRAWTAAEAGTLLDLAGVVEAEMAASLRLREAEAAGAALRESEARCRALFEVSPQMVWFADAEGRCTYVNQHYADFVGLPAERALGDGWLPAVHPDDRACARAAWTGAVASGRDYEVEYRIRRGADGSHRWFLVRGAPLRGPDGRVERWIGVGMDIDDRRHAEDALRASEERFRRAMAIGTVGVLFFGLDGRMSDANPAFERMSGYGRDELRAAVHWETLTPPEFREATARTAAELAVRGETAPYEKQLIRKDGSRWWGLFAPTRLSGAGSEAECVEFIVDITDRKRAEAALRASEARLRELQAELLHVSRLSAAGQMAAALAHEVNQPLTAATSAVQAARRTLAASSPEGLNGQPPAVREAMDLAAEQALRAGQIVRRLRDFVVRGEADPQLESLPRLVEDAGALALVGAKERGVAVALRLEPGLPPVLADRIQIQQVLFNLMRNALEAMGDGGAPAGGGDGARAPPRHRELVVSAAPADPDTVEVAVADTGPGLAPEVAGRLFEPFVSTKPGGMGVGLSVCRTIVEAHGGRLWAEPNPGGGAVFRFTLPAGRPPEGGAG